jgi:hypothetical protein
VGKVSVLVDLFSDNHSVGNLDYLENPHRYFLICPNNYQRNRQDKDAAAVPSQDAADHSYTSIGSRLHLEKNPSHHLDKGDQVALSQVWVADDRLDKDSCPDERPCLWYQLTCHHPEWIAVERVSSLFAVIEESLTLGRPSSRRIVSAGNLRDIAVRGLVFPVS